MMAVKRAKHGSGIWDSMALLRVQAVNGNFSNMVKVVEVEIARLA